MRTPRLASFASKLRVPGPVLRLAGSSALRDAGTLGTGALLAQAITFCAAPVFLRLYQPADFGLYSFAYGAIGLTATLGTWKIERLIVVVPARSTAIRLLVVLLLIAAAGAVLLLVVISRPAINSVFPAGVRDASALVWFAPFWMFILAASTGFRSYSIRARKFKTVAAAQISRSVAFATGTIATGLFWAGLGGRGAVIMISWAIAADTCALLVQIRGNRRVAKLIALRPRLRSSLAALMTRRRTVGTVAFSHIISSINQQIPISTVTFAFGTVYAGWYSLAAQFVLAPSTIVTSAVSDVANQRLSRFHAERRPFSHLVLRATLGMAVVGALPFAAIIFLGPTLLPILFGPQWLGASQSVSVLGVATYLWFIHGPAGTVALIVDARRYILLWHTLRMTSLAGLGAAALFGLISYQTWLVLAVAGDALLYLLDAILEYLFAHTSEVRWRQCRIPAT
jgi:O-antigen/teichoic acid export membrane protein